MKHTIEYIKTIFRSIVCIAFLLMYSQTALAQVKSYVVKDGKMYIQLGRDLNEPALDSFLVQFNITDIGIKQFFTKNIPDSILKSGWTIELNNEIGFIISKNFGAYDIGNPTDRLSFAEWFPTVNSTVKYGYNRFKNNVVFLLKDSVTRFYLKDKLNADQVFLAGSFNNWSPAALEMQKTDSGWIADVKLGPGKYWYKFIADGNWMTDPNNTSSENDGLGNVNSVYFRNNYVFKTDEFKNAKKVFVSGSFNNWKRNELQMIKTHSGWELPIYLADGTHTYKFVVDGQWYTDEDNAERLPDGVAGFNSVIKMGTPHGFQLKGFTDAKQVFLSGSFNGWREDELSMHKTSVGWSISYYLGPGNHEYKFKVDGKWVADPSNPVKAANGNAFLIIQPNYTFRLKGFENAKQIFVAGNFNSWDEKSFAMRREGDQWVFDVNLSPGKYLYKFIVDGKWIIDPSNSFWEQNAEGTGNSVLWIGLGNK